MDSIKDRIERIKSDIGEGVTLVAVTKTRTADEAAEAVRAGVKHLGENRVQEFVSKYDIFSENTAGADAEQRACERIVWHILGPLQTNKVKYLRDRGALVQSFDRLALADEMVRRLGSAEVLLQVNISGESQKSGVDPDDVERILEAMQAQVYRDIRIRGMMCIAENADERVVGRQFEKMKKLFDKAADCAFPTYTAEYLSMGMSSDYALAVREGSNMVRIGTEIFGRRM